MTILLYDHIELEERPSKHLKVWKVWHLILYIAVAIFGIVNFIFLQNTMQLVNSNCILFPRQLEFHWVELPNATKIDAIAQNDRVFNDNNRVTSDDDRVTSDDDRVTNDDDRLIKDNAQNMTETTKAAQDKVAKNNATSDAKIVKREVFDEEDITVLHFENGTTITGNTTHRLTLDMSRTLFENDSSSGCQFTEFMPLLSTIFACVWITFFTMCPGGGHARSGLQQPWRILTPALVFAIVMVALTGHSFKLTNQGLHAFCAAFRDVTNSTTCSSVDPFLESSWNATVGLGARVASTRAAAAAVLATWALVAALLFTRCLAAPDFVVKRTGAHLHDPLKKVTPYLKKSMSKRSQRSSTGSPTKRDTVSVRSDPTVTTELVSASIEHDSGPISLMATPAKRRSSDGTIFQQEIAETANI